MRVYPGKFSRTRSEEADYIICIDGAHLEAEEGKRIVSVITGFTADEADANTARSPVTHTAEP